MEKPALFGEPRAPHYGSPKRAIEIHREDSKMAKKALKKGKKLSGAKSLRPASTLRGGPVSQ